MISHASFIGLVMGKTHVGGIVGYNENAVIDGCNSGGSIEAAGGSYVGGLAGFIVKGYIVNSHSTANVSGTERVGGAVGELNADTQLGNSSASGDVTGSGSMVGGLVGLNMGNIYACKASGKNITGARMVGGLVGWHKPVVASEDFMIKDSYYLNLQGTIKVTTNINEPNIETGSFVGGLIGFWGTEQRGMPPGVRNARMFACFSWAKNVVGPARSNKTPFGNVTGGVIGCIGYNRCYEPISRDTGWDLRVFGNELFGHVLDLTNGLCNTYNKEVYIFLSDATLLEYDTVNIPLALGTPRYNAKGKVIGSNWPSFSRHYDKNSWASLGSESDYNKHPDNPSLEDFPKLIWE
jgi:hypothetical protein